MYKALFAAAVLVCTAFGSTNTGAQSIPTAAASVQASDQFSALHAALDRTADTLLAVAVQRMANAASEDPRSLVPRSPESLVRDFGQKYRSTPAPSVGAAMKRLEQLGPLIDPILDSEGVPREIASVVVVESGGKTAAVSPKGAVGLWQLMADTARRYGLVVTPSGDERLDVEKSTRAAARYLRDLHQQFGSWPLALAAYNAGEQTLQKAVERAGTHDFIQISSLRLLPQETRNYVPAVLSVMQLLGTHQLPAAPPIATSTATNGRLFAVAGAAMSQQ
jgi:membrane-bound lytic murein transglycosylase D